MKYRIITVLLLLALIACNNERSDKESTNIKGHPTLEEMIGQMIMIGFRGFDIAEVSDTILAHIENQRVGGLVLFDYDVVKKEAKRNIKNPEQLEKLITDLQNHSEDHLFIAIDQEGGRVNRLKATYGFPASVSNQYLGQLNNLDSTKFYASQNAATLSQMGINVNFAPDVDLNINPENPVIGKIGRSYGADTSTVIAHASVWIAAHQKEKIISTLKHFPGHGSSHADSHYGLTDITDYWQPQELIPFKTLAQKDLVGIMTAHVVNNQLDTVPATLSKKIIKEIIRDDWKFDGLLFSDDLHMGAVNDLYDFETILKKSIDAGVDILLFGNNLRYDEEIPRKIIASVAKMVETGEISKERILQSYNRIIKAKSQIQ
ncbi:glycoside hydrolase family 3 protein [Portibacter marinus]|uniref:glycoside hydrolase family 3 protein n=1 Tax=Portibacter marinus TaxID=2898660 RepID=UPI001F33439A|nr:glycoside hydrolase family 3 protein [Portibacter marinus]